ncbi:MAG: hypothetical protein EOO70_01080 [Myxococcaceae bacterium]|nr:MAG: hypothetical protein EOO70_01080 [Myxococcaceae bacterium]
MVPRPERLQVQLGEPHAGWLPVELRAADRSFAAIFSYTPYDSLHELVTWLLGLCAGAPTGAVHWNTEPTFYLFEATPLDGDRVRFDVVRHERRTHDTRRTVVFTHEDSPVTIARTFWRALRRLETSADGATSFRELPSSDIALLGRRLEVSRG